MFHIGYLYNHSLNYNILLPDLRYTGLSEGDAIQMGWLDRKDVMQWIDIAPALFGDSLQAVVHGISMGAATTMMLSGEKLPAYIRCFVEDCGYTSVWDQFQKELKEQFGLPAFPLLYTASWLCEWQNGWNFKEASAVKQVAKCQKPMFFIHGDKDNFVPTYMVHKVYEAKPQPKELWIVPGADHATSYFYYPETSDKDGSLQQYQYNGRKLSFDGYFTDELASKAQLFVTESEQPFMLYMSFTAPHSPNEAMEEDLARFEGQPARSMRL